jgi:hypothetical protein
MAGWGRWAGSTILVAATLTVSLMAADTSDDARHFTDRFRPLLVSHCVPCHGGDKPKGKLRLDNLTPDFADDAAREHWADVIERLKAGEMPPKGKPRPPGKDVEALLGWLAPRVADAGASARAAQGRVVLRRLNRVEYENTVRDLLEIDARLKGQLPEDGSADGFDTASAAHHTSSFLMEKYLEAADTALNMGENGDRLGAQRRACPHSSPERPRRGRGQAPRRLGASPRPLDPTLLVHPLRSVLPLEPEPLPMDDQVQEAEPEAPPFDLDLRSKECDRALSPDGQRFNFFLIDTGWNEATSKLVHKHFPRFLHQHCPKDLLFILTHEQSVEVLKHAPYEIGHDPMILVYDLYTPDAKKACKYQGFRLALGVIRHPDQAMARLQEFFRFLVVHRQSENLDREIRRSLHREGIEGMIKILRESTTEII